MDSVVIIMRVAPSGCLYPQVVVPTQKLAEAFVSTEMARGQVLASDFEYTEVPFVGHL
jgi:hypothetical protein